LRKHKWDFDADIAATIKDFPSQTTIMALLPILVKLICTVTQSCGRKRSRQLKIVSHSILKSQNIVLQMAAEESAIKSHEKIQQHINHVKEISALAVQHYNLPINDKSDISKTTTTLLAVFRQSSPRTTHLGVYGFGTNLHDWGKTAVTHLHHVNQTASRFSQPEK
jgi:hypothetical protein